MGVHVHGVASAKRDVKTPGAVRAVPRGGETLEVWAEEGGVVPTQPSRSRERDPGACISVGADWGFRRPFRIVPLVAMGIGKSSAPATRQCRHCGRQFARTEHLVRHERTRGSLPAPHTASFC